MSVRAKNQLKDKRQSHRYWDSPDEVKEVAKDLDHELIRLGEVTYKNYAFDGGERLEEIEVLRVVRSVRSSLEPGGELAEEELEYILNMEVGIRA